MNALIMVARMVVVYGGGGIMLRVLLFGFSGPTTWACRDGGNKVLRAPNP